jgi:hypothetical protein
MDVRSLPVLNHAERHHAKATRLYAAFDPPDCRPHVERKGPHGHGPLGLAAVDRGPAYPSPGHPVKHPHYQDYLAARRPEGFCEHRLTDVDKQL